MANKSIQLSDGDGNLYPIVYNRVSLNASSDVNYAVDPNVRYTWTSGTTPQNAPIDGCTLYAMKTEWGYFQMAIQYPADLKRIYVRNQFNGTWGNWKRVFTHGHGWQKYPDLNVASAQWAGNVGKSTNGYTPNGIGSLNNYNLTLDIAGAYLIIGHAIWGDASYSNGLRGLRLYKNEGSVGEFFFHPSGNKTSMDFTSIMFSDGGTNCRLGIYQSSGATLTATDISLAAIYLSQ